MDGLIGVAIAVAIIVFIVWLIGKIVSIVLFVAIVIPIYLVLGVYAGVKFVAMNMFVALDKLFYLGFDVPVIAVWAFWGLVIGAAIQGCREMKIYGRKRTGVLIAIAPMLLLTLVGAVKIPKEPPLNTTVSTKPKPSDSSVPEGMVLIPEGEFEMGSNDGNPDENPVHTVDIDAFYMDRYEVTNAEYAAFLNDKRKHLEYSPSFGFNYHGRIKPIDGKFLVQPGYENHPVGNVTWYGAMAYAAWAEKRLPTEAEWEKAARGGLIDKKYPWGDTIDVSKANYDKANVNDTTAVGSYPANGYGLYDMAGNVSEWCLDEYNSDFYANSPEKNPISGEQIAAVVNDFMQLRKQERVSRGGSYWDDQWFVRCANRTKGTFIPGFRCVKAALPADSD